MMKIGNRLPIPRMKSASGNPGDARDRPQHLDEKVERLGQARPSPMAMPSGIAVTTAAPTAMTRRSRLTPAFRCRLAVEC